MFKINDNYQKLPGSYLFSTIAKKVNAYSAANPEKQIIRLGIGDVTQPIAPAIIDAMHKAVDEMGHAETFHGYAPDLGYDFLRNAIVANDYKARGCDISAAPHISSVLESYTAVQYMEMHLKLTDFLFSQHHITAAADSVLKPLYKVLKISDLP